MLVTRDLKVADVLAGVSGHEDLELVRHWPLNGLVELIASLGSVSALRKISGVAFCYTSDL